MDLANAPAAALSSAAGTNGRKPIALCLITVFVLPALVIILVGVL